MCNHARGRRRGGRAIWSCHTAGAVVPVSALPVGYVPTMRRGLLHVAWWLAALLAPLPGQGESPMHSPTLRSLVVRHMRHHDRVLLAAAIHAGVPCNATRGTLHAHVGELAEQVSHAGWFGRAAAEGLCAVATLTHRRIAASSSWPSAQSKRPIRQDPRKACDIPRHARHWPSGADAGSPEALQRRGAAEPAGLLPTPRPARRWPQRCKPHGAGHRGHNGGRSALL